MRSLLIAAIILTSGCARPIKEPITPGPDNKALVVIYRPTEFRSTHIEAPFTVNGKRMFELRPGKRAELLLAPGSHQLATRKAGGMQISAPGRTQIQVKAGSAYFIEWSAMTSSVGDYEVSSGVFRRVATDEGLREAGKTAPSYRSIDCYTRSSDTSQRLTSRWPCARALSQP